MGYHAVYTYKLYPILFYLITLCYRFSPNVTKQSNPAPPQKVKSPHWGKQQREGRKIETERQGRMGGGGGGGERERERERERG